MKMELVYRLVFALVLFGAVFISGTYRRRAREEGGTIRRSAEGGWIYTVRMLVSLPLLGVLLLYIFYPAALGWATMPIPPWLRILFSFVALLCLPLFFWVFRSIGKNVSETILTKAHHELVRTGPYRWVRHPLYASALLMIGSLGMVAANWVLLLYFAVGWLVFRYLVVPAEEKNLVAVFGEDYLQFRRETGAMFPRLFRPG